MSDTGAMGEPRWLDHTEDRAWRGLLRMFGLLQAAINRDLAQDRLSMADYGVLAHLSEASEGKLRISELADGLQWSKSRLSHQLSRMQARGLVCRSSCPSDARGTFAEVTPAGMEAIRAAAPGHVESIRRHLLERLTREQVEGLAEICDTVLRDLPPCTGEAEEDEGECLQKLAAGFDAEGAPAEDGDGSVETAAAGAAART